MYKKYEPITLRGLVSTPDSFSRNWANSLNKHGSQRILYTSNAFELQSFKNQPPTIDDYEGKHKLRKLYATRNKSFISLQPKIKWTKKETHKEKGK